MAGCLGIDKPFEWRFGRLCGSMGRYSPRRYNITSCLKSPRFNYVGFKIGGLGLGHYLSSRLSCWVILTPHRCGKCSGIDSTDIVSQSFVDTAIRMVLKSSFFALNSVKFCSARMDLSFLSFIRREKIVLKVLCHSCGDFRYYFKVILAII